MAESGAATIAPGGAGVLSINPEKNLPEGQIVPLVAPGFVPAEGGVQGDATWAAIDDHSILISAPATEGTTTFSGTVAGVVGGSVDWQFVLTVQVTPPPPPTQVELTELNMVFVPQ